MPRYDTATELEYQYLPDEIDAPVGYFQRISSNSGSYVISIYMANIKYPTITVIQEARPNTAEPFTYSLTAEGEPDVDFSLVDNWTSGEGTPEDLAR